VRLTQLKVLLKLLRGLEGKIPEKEKTRKKKDANKKKSEEKKIPM